MVTKAHIYPGADERMLAPAAALSDVADHAGPVAARAGARSGGGRHRRPLRLLVVLAAVGVLGGGAACGGGTGATEAKAPAAENQDGHTTEGASPSGGATCSFANLGDITPEEVAQCLYGTWRANDINGLPHIVADQSVVTNFFAHPWTSPDGSFNGCGEAPGGSKIVHCTFGYHGGTIDMTVDGDPAVGFVTAVTISAAGAK